MIPVVVLLLMAVFQVAVIARDQVLTVHAARAAVREAAVAADGGRVQGAATDVLDGADVEVWRGDVSARRRRDGALPVAHDAAARRCPVPGSGAGGPSGHAAGAVTRRRTERGAATMLVAVVIVVALLAARRSPASAARPSEAARAQTAADAAALAAADQLALGPGRGSCPRRSH